MSKHLLDRMARAAHGYNQVLLEHGAPANPQTIYDIPMMKLMEANNLDEKYTKWVAAMAIGLIRGYVGEKAIFVGARLRNRKPGQQLTHPIYNPPSGAGNPWRGRGPDPREGNDDG